MALQRVADRNLVTIGPDIHCILLMWGQDNPTIRADRARRPPFAAQSR
jgi:hypothetical protein